MDGDALSAQDLGLILTTLHPVPISTNKSRKEQQTWRLVTCELMPP